MKRTFYSVLMAIAAQNISAAPVDGIPSASQGTPAYYNDLSYPKELMLREIVDQAASRARSAVIPEGIKADKKTQEDILLRFLDSLAAKTSAGETDLDVIDAIWALGEVGGDSTVKYLEQRQSYSGRVEKANIAAALNKLRPGAAVPIPVDGMKAGDIIFRKGYFGMVLPTIDKKQVGHTGIIAGMENGELMVIDGWLPVRRVALKVFMKKWPYYGNRTTFPAPDEDQRKEIVDYAAAQLGKSYSILHIQQKGPDKFDCVGLSEAAYEHAGLNPTPDALESGSGWPLTPAEQYESTFPVGP